MPGICARPHPTWPFVVLVLGLSVLSGCGTADDRTQARDVVERFDRAFGDARGAEACAMLSEAAVEQLERQERKSCAEAVTSIDYHGGSIDATEVYITSAKIDLSGGGSAFLSRERGGWRISALGCEPADDKPRDRPFECELEA